MFAHFWKYKKEKRRILKDLSSNSATYSIQSNDFHMKIFSICRQLLRLQYWFKKKNSIGIRLRKMNRDDLVPDTIYNSNTQIRHYLQRILLKYFLDVYDNHFHLGMLTLNILISSGKKTNTPNQYKTSGIKLEYNSHWVHCLNCI